MRTAHIILSVRIVPTDNDIVSTVSTGANSDSKHQPKSGAAKNWPAATTDTGKSTTWRTSRDERRRIECRSMKTNDQTQVIQTNPLSARRLTHVGPISSYVSTELVMASKKTNVIPSAIL